MGYRVILDIIGSFIVGGVLFLVILNFHTKNMENKRNLNSEINAMASISTTMQVINDDFHRIGYCANSKGLTAPIITVADDNSITFQTDIIDSIQSCGNGVVDYVSYRLGNLNTSTPNPNDRFLERKVNNNAWIVIDPSVTEFYLTYFRYNVKNYNDSLSTPVATPEQINRVALKVSIINNNASYNVQKPDSVVTFKSSLSFELK